jgi:hypothetical protein
MLPLVLSAGLGVGVLAASGWSFSTGILFAVLTGLWWERIGFTRLLTRKDRPVVFRQTVT